MRRVSFEEMSCSVGRSLEQIGEWWTLLIIRDAMFGVRRFDELQEHLGISRNILAARLDKLVTDGIMERRRYQERPPRDEYVLTDKGKDLWEVMILLRQWGDRWVSGEGNEPLLLEHRACGHTTTAQLVCSACGEQLERRAVRSVPGPGDPDPVLLNRLHAAG
ncbi:MAG: transcriptional regulator [Acidimicrobiales bacterium]|nr:transcriptional regulator [Acidimicrobiales bacterium]